MDDIFEMLRRDHAQIRDLLGRLGAGGTELHELSQELVIHVSKHEAVEETYFWSAVREKAQMGFEEGDVWKALGEALSTEEWIGLGDSVDKGKIVGPMQPHPGSAR